MQTARSAAVVKLPAAAGARSVLDSLSNVMRTCSWPDSAFSATECTNLIPYCSLPGVFTRIRLPKSAGELGSSCVVTRRHVQTR